MKEDDDVIDLAMMPVTDPNNDDTDDDDLDPIPDPDGEGDDDDSGVEGDNDDDGSDESNSNDDGGNDDDDDTLTPIEAFLSTHGIDKGMIDVTEEDGTVVQVHYEDLEGEEQVSVLTELTNQALDLAKDPSKANKPVENDLIEMIRDSGKNPNEFIDDLVKTEAQKLADVRYVDKGATIDYDKIDDNEINYVWLKESNPDATEEELKEDLELAKKLSSYDRNTDKYRKVFQDRQDAEIKGKEDLLKADKDKAMQEQRINIANAAVAMGTIGDEVITDAEKEVFLGNVMELEKSGEVSRFHAEIFKSPENLVKAAYLYYTGESKIKAIKEKAAKDINDAYANGKKDALSGAPRTDPRSGKRIKKVVKKKSTSTDDDGEDAAENYRNHMMIG